MSRKAKKFTVGIGVFLFWMAVWEVASLIIAKSVILPSPPAVLRALFGLLKKNRSISPAGAPSD